MKKITFNAPIVLSFTLICFIALVLNYVTGGLANKILFSTYHSSLLSIMTYPRFLTYIFGHQGWEHFASNMVYILLLGPMLEEKYKSKMMIAVIAVTAIITSIINYIFFPNIALCGASGICFALILLSSFTGVEKGKIPLTFILIAIIFIGQEIVQGIFIADNISNLAHIIGGIVGAIFGFVVQNKKKYLY